LIDEDRDSDKETGGSVSTDFSGLFYGSSSYLRMFYKKQWLLQLKEKDPQAKN